MKPKGRTLSFRREKVRVTPVPALGTVSELSSFEEARIEQGKREWEERQRVKEERKGEGLIVLGRLKRRVAEL